jgi:hypothetical protein
MQKRRRFIQSQSLNDRLASFAEGLRARAQLMPSSAEKDHLLRRARQADTARHLDEWLNSPGLQPPK